MSKSHKDVTIAKYLIKFLKFSETFIYSYIKNAKAFDQIIFAAKRECEDQFPYDPANVYTFDKPDRRIMQMPISFQHRLLLTAKNRYFYNVMKNRNVKLIHAHFGYAGVEAMAVAKRLNIPLLTTFHGLDMSKLGRDLYYRIKYKELFSFGKAFIVEGTCMKNKLIAMGCPADKAKIIHLGIDLDKFDITPRVVERGNKIRFLMCSRFSEKKGIPYGITAFAKALKSFGNMELNIIGGDDAGYRRLIKAYGAGDKIKMLGRRSHDEVAGIMKEYGLI